jgi:G3E family GTPase
VGIDDALVKQKFKTDEDVFEMNNGCICCTVRVDLITILMKLKKRKEDGGRLDHIIIETTGLADPAPVAQTFFVDENIKSFCRLDAIVTLVDAFHVEEHLDEVKPEGVENEAVEQVAFADMLLLNKIDLVPEEDKLKKLEARLRSLNKWAPIERCQDASVALEKILSIRGFELDRVLEMDPEFLNVDGEHMHDDRVTSVGFRLDGELDMDKTNAWIAKLLQLSGKDIFRMKGVLAMAGMDEKFVYQGVHMQFKGEFSEPWGDEKPNCRLIFIGRDLDKAMITSGFQACKNVHQYILEKDIGSTTLRFKVGDTVLAKSSATDFSKGVVKAIFHKEPQFPPGHVVPYQIQLEGEGGAEDGTTVYSPADTDDFVRPIGDVSAGVGAMKIE